MDSGPTHELARTASSRMCESGSVSADRPGAAVEENVETVKAWERAIRRARSKAAGYRPPSQRRYQRHRRATSGSRKEDEPAAARKSDGGIFRGPAIGIGPTRGAEALDTLGWPWAPAALGFAAELLELSSL